MAILSKACKSDNFESHNSLKLTFTNIRGLRSNFVDCESFLESNSPDILPLCETNLDDCNCLSQWTYTGRICLITLYFQRQEIATIGKYRLTLNINSVGNYYVGLFLVYACVW